MEEKEIRYIEAKSILSKLHKTDSWFGIGYNMNLYRGCQHGCIYCDTRSTCYGIGDISAVAVKRNALQLLHNELVSKRKDKATIGTGSMNDPYMPVEKEMLLTRRALLEICDRKFPVHILTKSNLVTRDTDILQDISTTYAAVSLTITAACDDLAKKLEPMASPSSARFEAIRHLARKGIYTGVTMMPLLPFITDTAANIRSILQQAEGAGASYVLPMFGVTLRKGSRDYFYRALPAEFGGIKERYRACFREQYICPSPEYKRLNEIFSEECERLRLASTMQFYQPPEEKQLSLFPDDNEKES